VTQQRWLPTHPAVTFDEPRSTGTYLTVESAAFIMASATSEQLTSNIMIGTSILTFPGQLWRIEERGLIQKHQPVLAKSLGETLAG
jgi:hypothetical protein